MKGKFRYSANNDKMTRDKSQKACQELDEQSHLAAFASESEFKTFQKARSGSVVLGLRDGT